MSIRNSNRNSSDYVVSGAASVAVDGTLDVMRCKVEISVEETSADLYPSSSAAEVVASASTMGRFFPPLLKFGERGNEVELKEEEEWVDGHNSPNSWTCT